MLNTFSNRDRLKLQQLLTHREIADSTDGNENKGDESNTNNQLLGGHSPLPAKWRLIPEGFTLHQWQSDCLKKWLDCEGKGTVKVATGGGKTLFALVAAQALQNQKEPNLRLVIVAPTIPLMFQWKDELKDANLSPNAIGLMWGSETPEENNPDLRVLLCVINSAREKLPGFVKRLGWSANLLLVVDECHRASASKSKKIFESSPRYTLGLSATPETDAEDKGIPTNEAYAKSEVGQALGPIVFEFSLKESMAAGLLTPFEVIHVGLSLTGKEIEKHAKLSSEISDLRRDLQIAHRSSKSSQGFIPWCQIQAERSGGKAAHFIGMANERKRLIYSARARTDLTLRILSATKNEKDRRVIVFHESIDEINRLFVSALKQNIPTVLEHSKLSANLRANNIEIFRRGIARAIISAKSLVEGFNVPSADIGIIAASSGSVRQRIQSLGRMLRKKSGDRKSIIFVLYIRDTEDEAIYQKADWEVVIGAERNRYMEWSSPSQAKLPRIQTDLESLLNEMRDTNMPPRTYRPLCSEVESSALKIGDTYPAQTTGVDMKVDQSGNLRLEDRNQTLVKAPREAVDKIIDINSYRRAVRTPCGHLIVRTDTNGKKRDENWIYLGDVDLPEPESMTIIKLSIKSVSSRRVIAKKVDRNEVFARGLDRAESPGAGQTQQQLLKWIRQEEKKRLQTVRSLYWDGASRYWIELSGEKIIFPQHANPLEFLS